MGFDFGKKFNEIDSLLHAFKALSQVLKEDWSIMNNPLFDYIRFRYKEGKYPIRMIPSSVKIEYMTIDETTYNELLPELRKKIRADGNHTHFIGAECMIAFDTLPDPLLMFMATNPTKDVITVYAKKSLQELLKQNQTSMHPINRNIPCLAYSLYPYDRNSFFSQKEIEAGHIITDENQYDIKSGQSANDTNFTFTNETVCL